MIEGINAALAPIASATPQTAGPANLDGSFGSLVRKAVESLEKDQHQAEQEIARAVAGESPDLHRTVIALQTSELSFQLALQVRNKLVNAYEEIMRMQV